jgi:hypothetical protein
MQLNHHRAPGADKVVMMPIIPLPQQLEPRLSIPELVALDHSHPFQKVD